MNIEKITQIAREKMLDRKEHESREPGWLFFHGLRTAKIAQWLSEQLHVEVDPAVIYTASLFHDIGKGKSPHNENGAAITRTLLDPECTPEKLGAICNIIQKHCLRGDSNDSPVVKIVQDADILDHVGLIGPWLAFYWSGVHNETIDDHIRHIDGDENKRLRAKMRSLLNFEISRTIFDERISYEDEFFYNFRRVYQEGI